MKERINGIDLFYEESSQGKNVILLHGNGEDHSIFDTARDVLSKKYHVFAPDSRGHGQSGGSVPDKYEEMACDTAELIRVLQIKAPLLFGFSDGGIAALLCAAYYGDLLSGVIACGANITPNGLKALPHMQMRMEYFLHRGKMTKLMLREPHIPHEILKKINCPVWILAGENDLIRESHTREIAGAITSSHLVILHGETHGSYIVNSAAFCPYIDTAMQEIALKEEMRNV